MGASPPSVHLSDVNVTQRVFRVHMDAHVEKYVLTLITQHVEMNLMLIDLVIKTDSIFITSVGLNNIIGYIKSKL